MTRLWIMLAGAASLLAASAHAEPVSDAKSGFAVEPPAGYEAKAMPGRGANSTIFSVKKADDRDTGCQVGYGDAPQNAGLAQDDINTRMKSPQHQDLAKAAISGLYETKSVNAFEHGEVTGLELVSDIKPREGIPPRAQEIRNLMIIMETPKGRASVVCVADKTNFEERRPEFRKLAHGVTLPK